MIVDYQRNGLGPRQRRAFAPSVQCVQPLLFLSERAQIFPMHVETVGAAVDLRGPQSNQMQQRFIQPTLAEIPLQDVHGIVDAGSGLGIVESCFHKFSNKKNIYVRFYNPLII